MSGRVEIDELKGAFGFLVDRCGGVVPCAARLGVSHQWISDLQNPRKPDAVPSFLKHVLPLEEWQREPVVTSYYARKAGGGRAGQPLNEVMQAVEALVAAAKAIRTDEDKAEQVAAILEAKRQLDDVYASLTQAD